MTKQKLPGWWQTSRQVQASADEAANHVTCLNYDVDRVPKLSEAQVLVVHHLMLCNRCRLQLGLNISSVNVINGLQAGYS